jgi:hypothetical protein
MQLVNNSPKKACYIASFFHNLISKEPFIEKGELAGGLELIDAEINT